MLFRSEECVNFLHLPDPQSVKNSIEDSNEMLSKILISDPKKGPKFARLHLKSASSVSFFQPLFVSCLRIEVSSTLRLISSPLELDVHSVSESSDIWHTYFSLCASNSILKTIEIHIDDSIARNKMKEARANL